ncbi:hypothetical protein SASPL_157251 [Salvia splendens]|uniref:Uncharacterized protein n=1 Tax=Salvia splendens TaxID=180675 RepID=A0A8X8VV84_SALSN|nr:hypothetical protein SASPL_157251 [Salvia splendens]
MAKTAALMLVALFAMSALFSTSESATAIDYSDLIAKSIPARPGPIDRAIRPCLAIHQCRGGNRKLLSGSEMSISVAVQATEKKAQDLKTQFISLIQY